MFIHLENQFFNIKNCLYFEYKSDCLILEFQGTLNTKVKQSIEEYKEFIEFIKEHQKILNIRMIDSFVGINLEKICGFFMKDHEVCFQFNDGLIKTFSSIEFEDVKKIIEQEL